MNAIKAQALADFIVKFTPSHGDLDGVEEVKAWVVHTYAGGIGVVLKSLEGDKLKYATHL